MKTNEKVCPRCGSDDLLDLEPMPGARRVSACLACLSNPDADHASWSPPPLEVDEFVQRHAEYLDLGLRTSFPVRLTRACGHDEVLSLPLLNGADQVCALRRQRCGPCVEDWEAAIREAAAMAELRSCELDLPALVGSPRQVAWANQLRVKAIDRHGLDQIGAVVDVETSAKWWIEARQRLFHLKVFREHDAGLGAGTRTTTT